MASTPHEPRTSRAIELSEMDGLEPVPVPLPQTQHSTPNPKPTHFCNFRFGPTSRLSYFTIDEDGFNAQHGLSHLPKCFYSNDDHNTDAKTHTASIVFAPGHIIDLQLSFDDFDQWMTKVSFSPRLYRLCRSRTTIRCFLECDMDIDTNGTNSLSIIICWKIFRRHWVLVFLHYDIARKHWSTQIMAEDIQTATKLNELLQERSSYLVKDPFYFLGCVISASTLSLENMQYFEMRKLQEIEVELGVSPSERLDQLRQVGFVAMGQSYESVNAKLLGFHSMILTIASGCNAIKLMAQQLVQIKDILDLTMGENKPMRRLTFEINNRLDQILNDNNAGKSKGEVLFSVLFNLIVQRDSRLTFEVARAAKQDSTAMKTISILTLTFLPATFVSAVFSTTIFDFQNWGNGPVASKGWWTYIICCAVLTIITFVVWFRWIGHERFELESSNLKEGKETQTSRFHKKFTI